MESESPKPAVIATSQRPSQRLSQRHVTDDADDPKRDGVWVTYQELADARGISVPSARRLAFRRKLARQRGNDGTTRVMVPVTYLQQSEDPEEDDPNDVPTDDAADNRSVIRGFELAIEALREQLERSEVRAERAEAALKTAYQQHAKERAELTEQLAASRTENAVLVEWLSWWHRWRWKRRRRRNVRDEGSG